MTHYKTYCENNLVESAELDYSYDNNNRNQEFYCQQTKKFIDKILPILLHHNPFEPFDYNQSPDSIYDN
ncbi:MAG: hypothetical protein KGZ71_00305 [Desulfobulbaceae bacterium]|nr:hypothetical protein [Desulfobulbaceae bacterium]